MFIQQLADRFEQLAQHPRIGRARTEYGPGLRSVAEGDYVIIYCVREDALDILRVLHGRRDVKTILQSPDK